MLGDHDFSESSIPNDTDKIDTVEGALQLLAQNPRVSSTVVDSIREMCNMAKSKQKKLEGKERFIISSTEHNENKILDKNDCSNTDEIISKAKSNRSKQQLSPDVVLEIFHERPKLSPQDTFRRGSLLMCKAVAPKYGVTPKTVRDIWRGRTWSHVTMSEWTEQEKAHHAMRICDDGSDEEQSTLPVVADDSQSKEGSLDVRGRRDGPDWDDDESLRRLVRRRMAGGGPSPRRVSSSGECGMAGLGGLGAEHENSGRYPCSAASSSLSALSEPLRGPVLWSSGAAPGWDMPAARTGSGPSEATLQTKAAATDRREARPSPWHPYRTVAAAGPLYSPGPGGPARPAPLVAQDPFGVPAGRRPSPIWPGQPAADAPSWPPRLSHSPRDRTTGCPPLPPAMAAGAAAAAMAWAGQAAGPAHVLPAGVLPGDGLGGPGRSGSDVVGGAGVWQGGGALANRRVAGRDSEAWEERLGSGQRLEQGRLGAGAGAREEEEEGRGGLLPPIQVLLWPWLRAQESPGSPRRELPPWMPPQ